MRLLVVSPHFPFPPHGGSLIRTWEMIRFLGRRHQLTFVAISGRCPTPQERAAVEAVCHEVHVYPTRSQPAASADCPAAVAPWHSPDLEQLLGQLAARPFDRVLLERIYLAHFAPLFSCPLVLCEHNIESDLFRHYSQMQPGAREALRWRAATLQLAAYEERCWPWFPWRLVVSQRDREILDRRCPSGRTLVVPNGTDTSSAMLPLQPDRGPILFTGLLNYLPNIEALQWLLEDILPRVQRAQPALELVVAGAQPTEQVRQLCSRPGVTLYANPPDMEAIASQCRVLAAPLLRGAGSRIKIVQAYGWGLPVVATSAAREGLLGEDGVHLWQRDEPEAFAQALLDCQSDWHSLRDNARGLCQQHYDWSKIWQAVEDQVLTASP